MIDPEIGQIWIDYTCEQYVFIRRINTLYIYYDIISQGHISGSSTIDGFKYRYRLYQ